MESGATCGVGLTPRRQERGGGVSVVQVGGGGCLDDAVNSVLVVISGEGETGQMA